MELTEEQLAIVHSDTDLRVNAIAGSGKTSTLLAYAEQCPDKRILYLVFNKSVRDEARQKFREKRLNHVTVETAHSLAFRWISQKSRSLKLKHAGYSAFEVREILDLSMGDLIQEMKIASHVVKMASCFCNGAEHKLKNCPYLTFLPLGPEKSFAEEYFDVIHQLTRDFLRSMHQGKIPITHEFYLKLYQLETLTLPYDIILFDEGQDASGVMLDVFMKQKARKVIVGDQHQQIYSWRYAINALETIDFEERSLTNSFRFPQDIADRANEVLSRKRHLKLPHGPKIKGLGRSKINTNPLRATLGRTNSGIFISAIEQLIEKKDIQTLYFEGNFNSYAYADENGSIWDIFNLHQGKKQGIRNKMVQGMKDMDQLKEYAEETNDSPLKGLIDVVLKYEQELPYLISTLKKAQVEEDRKEEADMIFSTIHKAKGMEYDEVNLVNDFMTEERLLETLAGVDERLWDKNRLSEEINLLYVGVTRTRNLLKEPDEKVSKPIGEGKRKPKTHEPLDEFLSDQRNVAKYKVPGKRQSYKNAYKTWTKEEDQVLLEMFENNQPIATIGDHLGRKKGAIYSRLKKLGLPEE